MTMEEVMAPVKEDIKKFEELINRFLTRVPHEKVKKNYETFFKVRGKYLRPTLLMLAAGAVGGEKSVFDHGLYRLALILELLHSASLVHDDIVDDDLQRRGQATVNQVFGNKVAVLAGDTLFSYAFKEATEHYDKAITLPVTSLALDMCMGELEQANGVDSKAAYLRVIRGKTARFMAVTCELGARYVGATEEIITKMNTIGLNIGMTYQMVDDRIDGDPNAVKYITEEDITKSYQLAGRLISELADNEYRKSLQALLDYIYGLEDN